jgi:hypothetical protein
MYPKFITKSLILSSNNEKIIYQNLSKHPKNNKTLQLIKISAG